MANYLQRERSRSPRRRSRSPRRGRRSYSPRSRSRSREDYRRNDRRSRSPVSGAAGATGGHSSSGYGGRGPSGCGIVEYATREQAQNAVATLSNQNLMGRLVYVREDREAEPRFTGPPARGDFGAPGRGGYGGYAPGPGAGGGRQIYVSNLPFNVGWQDLKDLFRQAGNGRPKGSGIVAFESADDARNAIQQFNGYDWQGRTLEVREDRYAGAPGFAGRGGFGG
ncbi:hypothetical protein EMPG_14375, partial [Blastomyces silverae]